MGLPFLFRMENMADTIKIQLDDAFLPVTDEQVKEGKAFVLKRERAATALATLVDALLVTAAADITQICYRYGVEPKDFQLSSRYNEKMFEEVAQVLDELEDEILDYISVYSTKCTKDNDEKKLLLLWILALGKNNMGLRKSLEQRLRVFSRDVEAMIVAAKLAKMDASKAVTTIRSYIHTAYQMPGMASAFKNASLFKAEYIRTRGVKQGNVGSSNSEANNILRFARTTLQMGWMRWLREEYDREGAIGFYVLRGSTYPCSLCDSKVGFHTIGDVESFPPYHSSCCCWTVPVFERDINDLTI